jgi:hypothetical protein
VDAGATNPDRWAEGQAQVTARCIASSSPPEAMPGVKHNATGLEPAPCPGMAHACQQAGEQSARTSRIELPPASQEPEGEFEPFIRWGASRSLPRRPAVLKIFRFPLFASRANLRRQHDVPTPSKTHQEAPVHLLRGSRDRSGDPCPGLGAMRVESAIRCGIRRAPSGSLQPGEQRPCGCRHGSGLGRHGEQAPAKLPGPPGSARRYRAAGLCCMGWIRAGHLGGHGPPG